MIRASQPAILFKKEDIPKRPERHTGQEALG